MFLGDAHIEIPIGMLGLKPVQTRSVRHGPSDGNNPRIVVCHFGKMVGKNLTVGGLSKGLGLAGLGIVGS